jgi:hypothetical protein
MYIYIYTHTILYYIYIHIIPILYIYYFFPQIDNFLEDFWVHWYFLFCLVRRRGIVGTVAGHTTLLARKSLDDISEAPRPRGAGPVCSKPEGGFGWFDMV